MDDPHVTDFLDRLQVAARRLPDERRAELVDDVREHLDMALTEADTTDEATIRAVLTRLGAPDEIVAAELDAEPANSPAYVVTTPTAPGRPRATVEVKALALLTIGAFLLPFVGPLIALGYVWSSARWTTIQKRTATIAVVGLLFLPAWILLPMLVSGEITAVVNNFVPLMALVPLAGILTAAYLAAVLYLELSIVARSAS